MLLAPVAVLPVAALSGAALWVLLISGVPAVVAAVLVVGLLAWLSRGMHWDGLADSADGLAASFDRDRALRVMSTGDVGPAGAITIAVLLIAQVGSLADVAGGDGWRAAAGFALVVVASRVALAIACVRGIPAAKPDGLGATVAGSVPMAGAAVGWVITAAMMCAASVLIGRPWWQGLVAAAVALVVLVGWLRHIRRRFGGINGDVLGASIEIAMTVLLVVVAAA